MAFGVEQAVHDQIKFVPDRKWLARGYPELDFLRRTRTFLVGRLDYFYRKPLVRIAILKINVLCGFIESNGVSRIEINLRTCRQLITLSKVAGDGKFRCAEFGAPIFDCERFAGGIF